MLGRLLDDYDAEGVVDMEHENDLKLVGAAMYGGEQKLAAPMGSNLIRT